MSDEKPGAPDPYAHMSTIGMSKAELLSASPRLFDNDLLDKLSRVHWAFPLMYVPVALWLIWLGAQSVSLVPLVLCIALGYVIWTFAEYVFHRWVFHTEFPGELGQRLHFLLHGVHHVHPSDPLRLVMPPLMSAPLMLLGWIVVRAIFGAPAAYPVEAGFLLGYVLYDEIHYHIHHRVPRTKLEQTLRRLHLLHHFRDPARGYGVSAPWWDTVFKTDYAVADRPGDKPL